MKILIIDGGPRLGNTWRLTTYVKEELKSCSKDIEFDEIHLKDLDLPFCLGCSACFRNGHENCPHNKVMQIILDKMDNCDGLIFSAPTNNMQVPALAKNFIDHLCYMLHRPRYFNKKGLVISTTGGVGAKAATKYVAGTLTGIGFNRCYQLPIASISWNDYKISLKDKKKAALIARKFYSDIFGGKLHAPSFGSILVFNIFRGLSIGYRKGSEFETKDGEFWQQEGYINMIYAPKIPVSFIKRLYGTLFFTLGKTLSKKLVVTYKK